MGKQNRQRRADKKRRRGPTERSHAGWSENSSTRPGASFGGRSDSSAFRSESRDHEAMLKQALFLVLDAARQTGQPRLDEALDMFEELGQNIAGSAVVPKFLANAFDDQLGQCWHDGWQPADVMRLAQRHLDSSAALVARLSIANEARLSAAPGVQVPDEWADQLADIVLPNRDQLDHWLAGGDGHDPARRRTRLRTAASLLVLLWTVPKLPRLIPEPRQWPRGVERVDAHRNHLDPKMLEKVRALLAKAESTDFEEEATSLTAKAQELIAKHAISRALLDASRTETSAEDRPTGRRIGIDDPYAGEKSLLLTCVAEPNNCRCVWYKELGFSTVFGFAEDIDSVELLYTSLLVQATTAMVAHGSQRDRYGRSHTRSFRQSFLVSFATRIGERLQQTTDDVVEAATREHGASLVPVLASRAHVIDDAFDEVFGRTSHVTHSARNQSGWAAGRVAADLAEFGAGPSLRQ